MEEIIKALDQADDLMRKEFKDIEHTLGAPTKKERLSKTRDLVQQAITSLLWAPD